MDRETVLVSGRQRVRSDYESGGVMSSSSSCYPVSSLRDQLPRQKDIMDLYLTESELGRGTYGRVIRAQCLRTHTTVALKAVAKRSIRLRDFLREFNYSYYLSPHSNIINTFDVAFETDIEYVFVQERAPYGDLFEWIISSRGLKEQQVKSVTSQISSALDFIHGRQLVHRDVKPENVLVFDEQMSRVKLMDFGMTKRIGTCVRKVSDGIPYSPPEINRSIRGELYTVSPSSDVWSLAVLIYCSLTANFPWQLAHSTDQHYVNFAAWQRRYRRLQRLSGKLGQLTGASRVSREARTPPHQWLRFEPKLLHLLTRMLDPRPDRRCGLDQITRYLQYCWLAPVNDRSSGSESNCTRQQRVEEDNPSSTVTADESSQASSRTEDGRQGDRVSDRNSGEKRKDSKINRI